MRLLAHFYRRFLKHKTRLALGFVSVPLTRLTDIAVTLAIGAGLNGLQQGEGSDMLRGVLGWVALYALVQALFSFLQRWCIVSASRFVERDLKQDLFDKLTHLSFDFHNQSRSGDVVSRLTSDVENVRMFLGPGLMFSLGGLVMLPITLVLLLRRDAELALTMVVPLTLMGLSFKLLAPRLHAASKDVQEAIGDISHAAQENFAGIRVVKGYGREEHQAARFAEASARSRDHQIRLGNERGWAHTAATSTIQLTFVVILWLGGRAMIDGTLGYGDTLVFVDLTLKLFWPILTLGWIAGMYPRAAASAQRIDELLAREPGIESAPDARELEDFDGSFRLRGVSFTYPGADHPARADVDLDVPRGRMLGIVGPPGSGQSTLLNLFGRLHDAEGTFEMGGVPLKQLTLGAVRRPLGYVPQDSVLFSDTWRDNVAFGADEPPSLERIEELARLVCMEQEVTQFPGGYDQLIGERGVTLSGGQRQRTCIARALAREPRVLVLDDALSAVDTETESRLIEHLQAAGAGRTVLLSAHRLSSVRAADQILVLGEDGRPADLGTHEQLLERGGWYAQTWRRQQAREELEEL